MGTQHILVIDDSPTILKAAEITLKQDNYEVWTAESAEQALKLIKQQGLPHLAIVDLYLPRMSGFDFCRKMLTFTDLPMIILSSEDRTETVVEGISNYAEDYVVKTDLKTFRKAELNSRVRKLLTRLGTFPFPPSPMIKIDDRLSLELANRRAHLDGHQIKLTPIENKILYILLRNRGQTVTSEYLIRRIWPDKMAFEDRLHTHVHRLRRKLENNPRDPDYIVAERKRGYYLPSPYYP